MSSVGLQYGIVLLKAAATTIWISWLALVLAAVVGGVVGLARTSRWAIVRVAAIAYVELFRSVPILVLMFFCYFGLPLIAKVSISPFAAATIALALEGSSLMSEVVRGGIESVQSGQWDAGRSSGMTHIQIVRHVVGPQALRVMLPPSIGVFIATLKDSSVASVIGYLELTKTGLLIRESIGHSFEILACVSLMYFAVNFGISLGGSALEGTLNKATHE
jgi:His/Glu/Gln/Arg/opine family amino acid ABC transporter permease subunit